MESNNKELELDLLVCLEGHHVSACDSHEPN